MKYNPLSRRAFLQGSGGLFLSVPFMMSLSPTEARAATATPKFAFFGIQFGRDWDYWYPRINEGQFTVDANGMRVFDLASQAGDISPTLSPLNGLRRKLSILQGLDSMQPDSCHDACLPLTASGGTGNTGPGFGYSLDVILEESQKFYSPLGTLRTCAHVIDSRRFSYSFSSTSVRGQNLVSEYNPARVYNKYFDPTNLAANSAANGRKQSITNSVMEDFKRMMNSRKIASEDKSRLDNYMTLLTQAEKRLGISIPACGRAADPGTGFKESEALQTAMIDLEVAALACGLTNSVVHAICQWSSTLVGDFDNDYHGAAHGNGALKTVGDRSLSNHANYDKWAITRFAEFLNKLDGIPDADGRSLLDNTTALFSSPDGRGFHSQIDLPVIVAGNADRLKMGSYIDFRPRPFNVADNGKNIIAGRPYNNLLISIMKSMGLKESDYQRFGKPGFGTYQGFASSLANHYQPYIAAPDATLPTFYKG